MLLIAIPVLGAVGLAYFLYANIQKKEIEAYCAEAEQTLSLGVAGVLQEAQAELVHFNINSDLELYLHQGDMGGYYDRINAIQELILIPVVSKSYVEGVYIYNGGKYVMTKNGVARYEDFQYKDIFEVYDGSKREIIVNLSERGYERKALAMYSDIGYGAKKGAIAMCLDVQDLQTELRIPEEITFGVAKSGTVLVASETELLGKDIQEAADYFEAAAKKTKYLFYNTNESSRLETIVCLDMEKYNDQLSQVRLIILLIVGVALWLTAAFCIVISIKLFQPIEKIVDSIRQYDLMPDSEDKIVFGENELEYILKNIQLSADKRKNAEEQLAERIEMLKKAQAVALQTQINPHFLNNTLENLNWMAMDLLGAENDVSEMVVTLSKMLRLSLGKTDILVSVSKELEHCRYYLQIMEKRYSDMFTTVWELDEEIYACRIVRIVLQPLVENAIYHGIKKKGKNGILTIRGCVSEDRLILSVQDNGVGMTEEKMKELRLALQEEKIREENHIGILNVNQRLRLFYGSNSGMTIESIATGGVKVTISVPADIFTED